LTQDSQLFVERVSQRSLHERILEAGDKGLPESEARDLARSLCVRPSLAAEAFRMVS
jgi:hypothetical protein